MPVNKSHRPGIHMLEQLFPREVRCVPTGAPATLGEGMAVPTEPSQFLPTALNSSLNIRVFTAVVNRQCIFQHQVQVTGKC